MIGVSINKMKRRDFLKAGLIGAIGLAGFTNIPNVSLASPISDLTSKFRNLTWVSYSPTNYNPEQSVWPSDSSLRADINVLYNSGIRGLVTYGANNALKNVPRFAKERGLTGVVMGIYDVDRNRSSGQQEWNNAIAAKNYVDGYCVGNEGLYESWGWPDMNTVKQYIINIKNATGKPATTSEQQEKYVNNDLLNTGDWLFPVIHPFWQTPQIINPQEGVNWTVEKYNWLKGIAGGRFVMTKETGLPTAGDTRVSQQKQYDFYRLLLTRGTSFCFFEAFDNYWKQWRPVEPYWGLWDKNRNSKKVVSLLGKSSVREWMGYE